MTAFPRPLLSLLLAVCCCLLVFGGSPVPRRRIIKTLYLNNGMPWGSWGKTEFCEDGSFAAYLEAKFEPYNALDADETALNGLLLYCINFNTSLPTGHISSTVGKKGEWQGMKVCSQGYLTSIRARVLDYQGAFGDDVAVQNFQLECDHSSTILTAVDGAREAKDTKIPLGEWGDWATCPHGSAICGIETRYSDADVLVDDTAISDVVLYCCLFNGTVTRTT